VCIPGAHLAMKLYFKRRRERELLAAAENRSRP
jgi:hypothetical protein